MLYAKDRSDKETLEKMPLRTHLCAGTSHNDCQIGHETWVEILYKKHLTIFRLCFDDDISLYSEIFEILAVR